MAAVQTDVRFTRSSKLKPEMNPTMIAVQRLDLSLFAAVALE